MSGLPAGWQLSCLADLGGTVGGKTPNKGVSRFWQPQEIPWASPKDIKVFRLGRTEDHISVLATTEEGMKVLPAGSVLMVTRSGILAHTFPVAITDVPMAINQDIKAVLPSRKINPSYLAYVMRALEQTILGTCTKQGTTVASVETHLLARLPLPIAPLPEQKRIADKLDTLLARVDTCRIHLARVPAILKRFRQSVLTAATSGALTREWREARHRDFAGWETTTVAALLDGKPRNGYSPRAVERPTAVKSLALTATTTGTFRGEHFKFIDEDVPLASHLWLAPGDILIQRANTLEYVGVSAIFDGPRATFIYPDLMMKCRANTRVITPFLHCLLSSEPVRAFFRANATGTAGNMPKINQQTILAAPAVLPPLDEQHEIVRRIETLMSLADQLEARYTTARTQIDRLTPALLGKAFRGELVQGASRDQKTEGHSAIDRAQRIVPQPM